MIEKLGEAQMAPIREVVAHMLLAHQPYPCLAVDRRWQVKAMNAPVQRLIGSLGVAEGDSLPDLLVSDDLRGVIENWQELECSSLQRLRTENVFFGDLPELEAAIEYLARVRAPAEVSQSPLIPIVDRSGDIRLSMFTTLTQFATPEDTLLDDLKIELYFPTDEPTAAYFRAASK